MPCGAGEFGELSLRQVASLSEGRDALADGLTRRQIPPFHDKRKGGQGLSPRREVPSSALQQPERRNRKAGFFDKLKLRQTALLTGLSEAFSDAVLVGFF